MNTHNFTQYLFWKKTWSWNNYFCVFKWPNHAFVRRSKGYLSYIFNLFEKNCYSSIAIHINCQTRRNGHKYYGRYIGTFPGTAHGVKGEVYAVNENTIYIREFSYDGAGPGMCSTVAMISWLVNYFRISLYLIKSRIFLGWKYFWT
jgi:hypothetical protein